VADVVDQLLCMPRVAQVVTVENRGLVESIVRAALDHCLVAIDPGAATGRVPGSRADLRCACGSDIAVLEPVSRAIGRLVWRRVADVGLGCGMTPDSLVAAADALFGHLSELLLPTPGT
jgi:hypothetical protein